jgi:predicted dehydrogenase
MRSAKLAIIGTEGYAAQLAERLHTLPRTARLVAAVSLDPGGPAARRLVDRGTRIFPDVEALLAFAPGQIDAILNPTPIPLHRPLTIQCLEAGFPVWLEKPPVARLEEMDELLAAVEGTGRPVDVCFNSLYSFRVRELKAELAAGVFGAVRRVRSIGGWVRSGSYWSRAGWVGRVRDNGTWIYDGTINNPFAHVVCNSLFFAAPQTDALAEFDSLDARLWHANPIESEDTSSIRLTTREGVEVLCNLTLCPEEEISPVTVIDTEQATISLEDFQDVAIAWHNGRHERRQSFSENRIEMLETLCLNLQSAGDRPCPLAMTRPFVRLVNAAFTQVLEANDARIPEVPQKLIHQSDVHGSPAVRIRGINTLLQNAHEQGKLLDIKAA